MSNNAVGSATQSLRIENLQTCGGDITITNISQVTALTVDFQQLATVDAVAQFQAAMRTALEQLAEKDAQIKNELGGLAFTDDSQQITNINKNINNMVAQITTET